MHSPTAGLFPRRTAALVGFLTALAVLPGPTPLWAQDWIERSSPSVGATIGTPGIGIEGSVRPSERFGFRLGLSWIPYQHTLDETDVEGTISPPFPITRVTADFFPMAGTFHLSVGIHHYSGGVSVRATPLEGIEINGREYPPAEIGEFSVRVWGRQTAPVLGLGWQRRSGRIQPYLDLGVLLTGPPRVSIAVSGPIGADPQFRADLDEEIRKLEDDLSPFEIFPHLQFGLRFRIGG